MIRDTAAGPKPPYLSLPMALTADEVGLLYDLAGQIATDDSAYGHTRNALNEAQQFMGIARVRNGKEDWAQARAAMMRATTILFGAIRALDKRHWDAIAADREAVAAAAEAMAVRAPQ